MTDPDQCIICLEALPPATATAPTGPANNDEQDQGQEAALTVPSSGNGIIVPIFEKGGILAAASGTAFASTSVEVDGDVDSTHVASLNGCNHVLHDACIRSWAQKTNTCPICRTAFDMVSVYDGVGGPIVTEYPVEEKKQVAEYDIRDWLDQNDGVEEEEEEVPCPVCNTSEHEDRLLLCDNCNSAYHTYCIGLDTVPEGHWYCMECADTMGLPLHQTGAVLDEDDEDADIFGLGREQTPTAASALPASRFARLFPRTRSRMRHARQQARTFDWQGPWGEIAGRVYDGLDIDLDNPFGEDDTLQHFRRSQQRSDRERREYERWQQRLNIASRLGAREVFARAIPAAISEHLYDAPPRERSADQVREERTERQAWGAFERAREQAVARASPSSPNNGRKRARSRTQSPAEPQEQEPERKLKRPRTRRLPVPGPGQGQGQGQGQASGQVLGHGQAPGQGQAQAQSQGLGQAQVHGDASSSQQPGNNVAAGTPALPPPPVPEGPTFLSSLLKEVEMSAPGEDDGQHPHPNNNINNSNANNRYVPEMSSPVGSPSPSGFSSPRAMTPPPFSNGRPSSPQLSLSSHIEPRYAPANYSPPRGGSDDDTRRASSPVRRGSVRAASPEVMIREPRPPRRQSLRMGDASPRMVDLSPTRQSLLPLEVKASISNMVRLALRPHWHARELSPEQYANINRDISHKLYEAADDMSDDEARRKWERLAMQEVARAVAELKS